MFLEGWKCICWGDACRQTVPKTVPPFLPSETTWNFAECSPTSSSSGCATSLSESTSISDTSVATVKHWSWWSSSSVWTSSDWVVIHRGDRRCMSAGTLAHRTHEIKCIVLPCVRPLGIVALKSLHVKKYPCGICQWELQQIIYIFSSRTSNVNGTV